MDGRLLLASSDTGKVRTFGARLSACTEIQKENGEKAGRGRRRKYAVEDLVECLGGGKLSTNEFRIAANKRCGMSRAMFYRLLKKGRKELRFRQRGGKSSPWEAV
jgi:hypothetical protein